MRNKVFTKIIITTLLVTFLTFNVGRVTHVSAVGTTAAIASTAFLLTGAVYLSYIALTHGEMVLPASDSLHDWLGNIGRKVSQYPSGQATYQEIYQNLAREPVTGVLHDVWTWTQDKIKSFVNDFSDTRIISDILQYVDPVDISIVPLNGFTYPYQIVSIPYNYITTNSSTDLGSPFPSAWNISAYPGVQIYYAQNGLSTIVSTDKTGTFRNYFDGSLYYPEQLINGVWTRINFSNNYFGLYATTPNSSYITRLQPASGIQAWYLGPGLISMLNPVATYPLFPNEVIYDAVNDEDLPLVIPQDHITRLPSWNDPDNENRPIIPWVPIPDIPTGIPTPPGYTGPPQWGFPLQDLLDLLESLAEALMSIDAIARIINEFAGQHGDNYYLEYNDGDTNYYTYYQPTIFDNDTEYVTYNIDVSEQDDTIPVDLNTISLYSDNRYLDQIKKSAIAGSSMLRDLAVFWHDIDPEITYIVLGCYILVLIGAFTGKLGHS